MNFRAPYSPATPARKAWPEVIPHGSGLLPRENARFPRIWTIVTFHLRLWRALTFALQSSAHDNPHPEILWNHRPARPGRRVVLAGHDHRANAMARSLGALPGNLLRRRGHRLGAAGDADHQLDVAPGCLN